MKIRKSKFSVNKAYSCINFEECKQAKAHGYSDAKATGSYYHNKGIVTIWYEHIEPKFPDPFCGTTARFEFVYVGIVYTMYVDDKVYTERGLSIAAGKFARSVVESVVYMKSW